MNIFRCEYFQKVKNYDRKFNLIGTLNLFEKFTYFRQIQLIHNIFWYEFFCNSYHNYFSIGG